MELERYVPGMEGTIWYEHWHRYHFATLFAAGRAVVDAACGEGYGSALLARTAASVSGYDLSGDVIALARRRYGEAANLEFHEARCEALPRPAASADLFVSFETIEHLPSPAALVAEAARVLRPEGLFLVSTPNKVEYSDAAGYRNPFHPSELYEDEFVALLRERFPAVALFGQRVDFGSAIWPIGREAGAVQLVGGTPAAPHAAESHPGSALYFIAACAASEAVLRAAPAPFSMLSDREHGLWNAWQRSGTELENARAHVARVEAAYAEARKRIAALTEERDRLAAAAKAPATSWQKR